MQPSKKLRLPAGHRPFPLAALLATAAFCLCAGPGFAQEGSAEAGQTKAAVCSACHGVDGNSIAMPVTPWPSLAGQHPVYLEQQIAAFRNGDRADVAMQPMVANLSEQDVHDIATWFASQSVTPKGADPALVDRGQRIYRGGIPERGVAACIACHGPNGQGNPLAGYPRISHQHAAYLAKTLRDYRSGDRRSDSELNQMMRNTAEFLLDEEIDALASYMQGLN